MALILNREQRELMLAFLEVLEEDARKAEVKCRETFKLAPHLVGMNKMAAYWRNARSALKWVRFRLNRRTYRLGDKRSDKPQIG